MQKKKQVRKQQSSSSTKIYPHKQSMVQITLVLSSEINVSCVQ